ncbi:MAG: ATP-dependent DNA helicase [Methanocalculus sp. MSAO_Arc1]|uniref:ATP-dependent DNA helicase n=1 Tax=Methanocalculus TaxID=71151 RepID=UPI000FF21EE3|nr:MULTISPECIES: ATP-dependent DNA helicase [unclassified Methanocalculus]MCP1661913.1 DNA excision repair protein ERCC-2 [Methanocalculus sp. AMF5]RQD81203.1 MAG: ATP-dependent DNA helicase [Methanocalculus sp. MSAO_Arc1]
MTSIDDWFPYNHYRPHQERMLDAAAETAVGGGILMIDAPTGSGKSSVVSALLAGAGGKTILIAVRTISQLNTFIRELELIRQKKPGLKFTYLIGKRSMCPLGGVGDVYRQCEGVKTFTTALMRERAVKGSLVPAKDPEIIRQIKKQDRDHPLICPYFVNSRVYLEGDDALRLVPSQDIRKKAEKAAMSVINPDYLHAFAGTLCPYDLMMTAAKHADVVIVNYHHLFNDEIREQLLVTLNVEPQDIILLVDEGHNVGDVVQGIQSVEFRERDIQQASNELASLKTKVKGAEAVRHVLPRIGDFMEGLRQSTETEDWFDPAIFDRILTKGSLYPSMAAIVEDVIAISDLVREKSLQTGEYKETSIERLCEFLYRIHCSSTDPAYLTVYKKDEDSVILEVRNIDPAGKLQAIAASHHACIFISGTLSPIESFKRYYFEHMPVCTLSIPNAFPKENRLLLVAEDITTAFRMRQDKGNIERTVLAIEAFAEAKGNLAVYFPSYQIMSDYASKCRIKKKKVFVESRDAREANELLAEFLSLPGKRRSGILFAVSGGKWSEGLDYRGELLAGAMVVGLPLAPYTRVRGMSIQYFKRKFNREGEFIAYTLPAINKAAQALGRVLRTPEDRGVLLLGDSRFLEPEVKGGLPPWMQEEMTTVRTDTLPGVIARWR